MALTHGYLPVVFNRRGQNGTPLSTVKLQQFGDPADLREAVRYIRYRQPAGRLYAVSESTGSGLLLSYLGECGSSSYVTAAACLSPIFRCQSWFESSPAWPFHWALLLYQKMWLSRWVLWRAERERPFELDGDHFKWDRQTLILNFYHNCFLFVYPFCDIGVDVCRQASVNQQVFLGVMRRVMMTHLTVYQQGK